MGRRVDKLTRATVCLLLALPIAFSVGYKNFVGGATTVDILNPDGGVYGLCGPPGMQGLGVGLSLFVQSLIPFTLDPGHPRSYGFNTFVASNTTTIMLDVPLPSYIEELQSRLRSNENFEVTATVSATVCLWDDPTAVERGDPNWWGEIWADLGPEVDYGVFIDTYFGTSVGLLTGRNNQTEIFLARWNGVADGFNSTAQRFFVKRARYTATWRVQNSGTPTLLGVQNPEHGNASNLNQGIMYQQLGLANLYLPLLREEAPPKPNDGNDTLNMNGFQTTVVASMLWSRQAEVLGFGGPEAAPQSEYAVKDQLRKVVPTMKNDWGLVMILVLNPVIVLIAVIAKILLYSTPVDERFNIVALLAAVDKSSLEIVRGAALTGELRQRLQLRFDVVHDEKIGFISIQLGQTGENGKLKTGCLYE